MTVNLQRGTRLKSDVSPTNRADVLSAACCRYCGDLNGPYEVDHVIPLSRGGTNERSNLVCACVSCNTQKTNHLLHEWIQWRTANGMSWPPVASHGTEPVHYNDCCTNCMRTADNFEQVTPYALDRRDSGYVARYRHDVCGSTWTCGWSHNFGYFSDCPCPYCVACRLEESA